MTAVQNIAFAACTVQQISLQDLLLNSPISESKVRQGNGSIAWNEFATWVHWLDQSQYSTLDWKQVGRASVDKKVNMNAMKIARMALSLKFAYWLTATWLGPSLYRGIQSQFEELESLKIRETLELQEGLLACPQLWKVFEGALEWAPKAVFGLPPSVVEAQISERKAIYEIQMPPHDTLWVRSKARIFSFLQSHHLLTELAQQQQKLQIQSARIRSERNEFRNLIETFPDGVLIHRHGTILYMNPQMASVLHISDPEEMIGRNVLDLVDPHQHEELLQWTNHFSGESHRFHRSVEISLMPRGVSEPLPCEYVCSAISYEGNPAVAAVFRDLTDRKKLQTHLMLTDRMRSLGQLAAGVGHEINNPLFFVMMKADLLREHLRKEQDTPGSKLIEDIEQGLTRISKIVRQLKEFTRGHEEESPVPTDVESTLKLSLGMAQNLIHHRAQLKVSIESLPPVLANEARLGQVFLNLLINAAQAIEPGRTDENEIEVRAFSRDGHVVVEVRDTGCGISKEAQKKLFDPFYTTKQIGEGTGLGLSICQLIVQLYHGSLDFETQVGWGSTFRVVFPATEGKMMSSAKKELEPLIRTSGKVLLIDDDEELLNVLETIVSDSYQVDAFLNAQQALLKIESGQEYDCIICDLMMPSMDGAAFYQKLTQIAPQLANRVVFMTGGSLSKQHDLFLATPGIHYREKPLNSTELMHLIQATISGGQAGNPVGQATGRPPQ